jgi:hypothetical protein
MLKEFKEFAMRGNVVDRLSVSSLGRPLELLSNPWWPIF